jgi:uncharacterized protein YfdQ (DUF2303 family)
MSTEKTEAQAVIDIARQAAEMSLRGLDPAKDARLVSIATPHGYTRELLDLSEYLPIPQRARGVVAAQTVDSFVAYVARHDDAPSTTIWADIDHGVLTAVIDDHNAATGDQPDPGWGDHRAILTLKPTDEWRHWTNANGRWMDQEAFAEHIEDGQVEITTPAAGDLLDIVQTMQGHTAAEWKSATRLDNGSVQFVYQEEATARAGGTGDIEIPTRFELLIIPFLGEPPVALTARLRYRVKSGKLTLAYKLDRPADVKRDAIDRIADRLAEKFGNARVFVGSPRETSTPSGF